MLSGVVCGCRTAPPSAHRVAVSCVAHRHHTVSAPGLCHQLPTNAASLPSRCGSNACWTAGYRMGPWDTRFCPQSVGIAPLASRRRNLPGFGRTAHVGGAAAYDGALVPQRWSPPSVYGHCLAFAGSTGRSVPGCIIGLPSGIGVFGSDAATADHRSVRGRSAAHLTMYVAFGSQHRSDATHHETTVCHPSITNGTSAPTAASVR